MRPRPTRGLLIRLLEVQQSQISQSFQWVRIYDNRPSLIWVPRGWVYSLARTSIAPFGKLFDHMNGPCGVGTYRRQSPIAALGVAWVDRCPVFTRL